MSTPRDFDKGAPAPPWVRDGRHRYYAALWQAQPSWADREALRAVYRQAGPGEAVDHIVPLTSSRVCGLHVADNLRIVSAQINTAKGNRWWPDSWDGEPQPLPLPGPAPHQLALFR